jgi:Bacterial regulatory protein, Fis family
MSLRDLAIERLLAVDPKHSIRQTLDLLMAHTGADRSGVFLCRGSVVDLFVGHGIDQASLDWVRRGWETQREKVRDSRAIFEGPRCLWPLGDCAGPGQVATLYLAGPGEMMVATVRIALEALGDLLQSALVAADGSRQFSPAIDLYLMATPTDSIVRRQLETLLHEHEWNVARVARILGVTRVTIYARMERLGIERLRVPKSRS